MMTQGGRSQRFIAKRICNEEQVLEEGLQGYREYKQKVRHKVIPFIW